MAIEFSISYGAAIGPSEFRLSLLEEAVQDQAVATYLGQALSVSVIRRTDALSIPIGPCR